ncbi:ABC transporter substrate-binding protein [Sporosarcina ureilytica]|uniref:Nickel ABC transporter substrate-binding protein n=1 Tax=Sporosarcina ureilytica TaxID=298596 RepID=A0A1D8JGX3_9BACL|nr:ABC transporter substrate-binding protein [Sporosarcina ureilytica]AOV07972.1 nickel ABC transporter substrate-binding protein [Sporosarcina ureilytica]
MIRKFWGFLVISIFAISVLVAGCSVSDSNNSVKSKEREGKQVDELIVAIGSEPATGFDPTTGWGRAGSPLFHSTLLTRDDQLNIVNDLASSYTLSEDGKVWTVSLRDDVKFSDGTPLTAEDVKFTFGTAMNSGSVVDLNIVEKVEVVDDTTVKFILKEMQSTFVNTLVETGIVPKHAYGSDYAENPVGSGPYQFVQWDKEQQLIVKVNPEYYGTKPYFQKITFLYLNEDAAFAAAQVGTVDLVSIPAEFSNKKIPGMKLEAIQTVDNRGIVFPYVKSGDRTQDGLPIGNDVTADPAIRQAINIAVDRKALIDGVLAGYGSPAYTLVDGLPWWNPDTVIQDTDVEGARKVLEDADWKDTDGDGILEKGALKAEFTLLYPSDDTLRQSLSIAVADMMKPLGIHIKVEGATWDVISQKMHSEAVLMGKGSHDPSEMYHIYGSDNAGIEYNNPGYYKNAMVDNYFKKALQAKTEDEAIEFWKQAQWDGEAGFSWIEDAPWAWLVNIDHLYIRSDRLDLGEQRIHVHGHGWPVTDNIVDWKWSQ